MTGLEDLRQGIAVGAGAWAAFGPSATDDEIRALCRTTFGWTNIVIRRDAATAQARPAAVERLRQPHPKQQEIDRQSAELLRDDAHARREQDGQLKSELRGYMPDVEWIEPRPDMGEPGGYQEVGGEGDIPF